MGIAIYKGRCLILLLIMFHVNRLTMREREEIVASDSVKKKCAGCGKFFKLDLDEIGGFYTGTLCVTCHNELVKKGFIKERGKSEGRTIQNN